jgi:hypothetical protein
VKKMVLSALTSKLRSLLVQVISTVSGIVVLAGAAVAEQDLLDLCFKIRFEKRHHSQPTLLKRLEIRIGSRTCRC